MISNTYPEGVLQRLQKAERKLLKVVDALCHEYQLTYFINSGTCLGAVRHGGFIPWDDDVDIAMPATDYWKFIEIAKKHLPDGYSLHHCGNTLGFSALWAKVFIDGTHFNDANAKEAGLDQGIFLDVFPFFPLDLDAKRARWQLRGCSFWQKLSYIKGTAHPKLPKNIRYRPLVQIALHSAHTLLKAVPQRFLVRKFYQATLAKNPSDKWFSAAYPYGGKYPDTVLFPAERVQFDGIAVMGPADIHEYLRIVYGDYMQLPPEEDRYTHLPAVLDFGDGINVMRKKKKQ